MQTSYLWPIVEKGCSLIPCFFNISKMWIYLPSLLFQLSRIFIGILNPFQELLVHKCHYPYINTKFVIVDKMALKILPILYTRKNIWSIQLFLLTPRFNLVWMFNLMFISNLKIGVQCHEVDVWRCDKNWFLIINTRGKNVKLKILVSNQVQSNKAKHFYKLVVLKISEIFSRIFIGWKSLKIL